MVISEHWQMTVSLHHWLGFCHSNKYIMWHEQSHLHKSVWNFKLNGNIITRRPWLCHCSLAPDCFQLLSSPNKHSGKYNEMDPILIGTAISEYVIREMIKPGVPSVKALWQMIVLSIFVSMSWICVLMTLLLSNAENKISASILAGV